MTAAEARRRFGEARVARLATASADGLPHLVAVTFALDGDRIFTAVDAKPKHSARLRRLSNVEANPQVSLLVDHYDEDWRRLWWARADGRATIVPAGPLLERARDLLRERYAQYRDGVEIIGPAIVIEIGRWSTWSAADA